MSNRYPLERPKVKSQIVAWLVEGKGPKEVADLLTTARRPVSIQAVCAFRKRHATELTTAITDVERQITDAAISSLINRVFDADADYRKLGQVIDARAGDSRYDEPGYATGLMVHSLKQVGSGRDATIVDEFKVDTAVVSERRALRHEVAEILGQVPQSAPNINIDNRTQILVREYGLDLKRIG